MQLFTSLRFDPALVGIEENTTVCSGASPFLLLPFHRDRLVDAATAFGWTDAAASLQGPEGLASFSKLIKTRKSVWVQENDPHAPVKVRPLRPSWSLLTICKVRPVLSRDGTIAVTFTPEPPRDVHAMFSNGSAHPDTLQSNVKLTTVHLDTAATAASMLTRHKTTSRDHYLDARERAGLGRDYSSKDDVILFNEHDQTTETSISNIAFWRDGQWITPRVECGGLPGVMRRWLVEQGHWTEGVILKQDVRPGEIVLLSNGLKGCYPGRVA